MESFNSVKGYATRENAVKKLQQVLGDNMHLYHWHVGVTPAGRFYPVVHGSNTREGFVHLAHSGICVTA